MGWSKLKQVFHILWIHYGIGKTVAGDNRTGLLGGGGCKTYREHARHFGIMAWMDIYHGMEGYLSWPKRISIMTGGISIMS